MYMKICPVMKRRRPFQGESIISVRKKVDFIFLQIVKIIKLLKRFLSKFMNNLLGKPLSNRRPNTRIRRKRKQNNSYLFFRNGTAQSGKLSLTVIPYRRINFDFQLDLHNLFQFFTSSSTKPTKKKKSPRRVFFVIIFRKIYTRNFDSCGKLRRHYEIAMNIIDFEYKRKFNVDI